MGGAGSIPGDGPQWLMREVSRELNLMGPEREKALLHKSFSMSAKSGSVAELAESAPYPTTPSRLSGHLGARTCPDIP